MQVDENPAQNSSSSGSNKSTPARKPGKPAADSWEDVDHSESTPATTPEDEDTSMGDDSGAPHVPASKPKTKVKPKPEEATTTEKEHVNVVFIGHVGKENSIVLDQFFLEVLEQSFMAYEQSYSVLKQSFQVL